MALFLGSDPADASHKWKEWHLQAYVIMQARRSGYVVHGDQNGVSKTPKGISMSSATGALPGWPDLCFVLPSGPLWIELKLGKIKRSPEQVELHNIMEQSGCRVLTIASNTPAECWDRVQSIIKINS